MKTHVMIIRTCGVVVEATSGGHASSLETARNLLIGLLLVVVEVTVLLLCTRALMPRTHQMMQRRLLPPSMSRLVHMGRSRLVPTCMIRLVHLGRSCLIKSCVTGR
jgi:hypothetical protein